MMHPLPRPEPRLPAIPHIGSTLAGTLAGTHDVTLDAGRDINILAATSTSTFSSYTHTTENGFMSNGGMSFTYGSRETTDKFDSTQSLQSQNRSLGALPQSPHFRVCRPGRVARHQAGKTPVER